MDMTRIERDVRFLKGYAAAMTLAAGVFILAAFTRGANTKFDEIDVQRINIMEPNGHYRMVISNRPRSIGPIYKGTPFGYAGGGRPGIIFFNDDGTENGGLTFTGSTCTGDTSVTTGRRCAKGTYTASTHMSFDQFNQDQVLNLDYSDNNGRRLTGISVNDRASVDIHEWVEQRDSIARKFGADTAGANAAMNAWLSARAKGVPLNVQRMFIGRDPAKAAVLNLADSNGKPRLRLVVDSLGAARIDFLDANGQVTNSLNGTTSDRR